MKEPTLNPCLDAGRPGLSRAALARHALVVLVALGPLLLAGAGLAYMLAVLAWGGPSSAPTDRELWGLTVPELVDLIARGVGVLRLRLVTGDPESLRVLADLIDRNRALLGLPPGDFAGPGPPTRPGPDPPRNGG